jgi:hypothetical protein
MATREQLLIEKDKAGALAATASSILHEIADLFKRADSLVPSRSFGLGKREREKIHSWRGIEERLLVAIHRPAEIGREIEYLDRAVAEKAKVEEKTKADKAAAEEAVKLRDRAIAWLLAKGKKLGEEFTSENAVQVADSIAYTEEVARRSEECGFIRFSGQNCDGPCEGWDGKSHRCDCGNRRVDWTQGWNHSFEHPDIEAEAY